MNRVFLFSYDITNTDSSILFSYLDSEPSFLNWRTPGIPGLALIVSQLPVIEVSKKLLAHMSGRKFFVAEVSGHSADGWVDMNTWQFINNPQEKPPLPTSGLLNAQTSIGALGGLLSKQKDKG